MNIKTSKDMKVTLWNYLCFIIVSLLLFIYLFDNNSIGDELKLILFGIFIVITGVWGQLFGVVFLRLPYCSFIYEKERNVLIVNILLITIGIIIIIWELLF